MKNQLLNSIAYVLPALVTGSIAYYIFRNYLNQQKLDKKHDLFLQNKKMVFRIQLQAYERLLLFCERINPIKLLIRINPISIHPKEYAQLLIETIEQEFDHNLAQQLYVSETSWAALVAAKIAICNTFTQSAKNSKSMRDFSDKIVDYYSHQLIPTEIALKKIKSDVKKIM